MNEVLEHIVFEGIEGSDEPAQMHSLAGAFPTHK